MVPELQPTGPTVTRTTFSKWGPALADRVGEATMVLCRRVDRLLRALDGRRRGGRGRAVQVVADACAGVDEARRVGAS